MKKITNYHLVSTSDVNSFNQEVALLMRNPEWQPFGGVSVALNEYGHYGHTCYAQAFVVYEQ